LIVNGGFERGLEGWDPVWTREEGAGRATLVETIAREGTHAIRLSHTGGRDWSLAQSGRLEVMPGAIYELAAWVRVEGEGSATLSVITRAADGTVQDWSHGARSARDADDWRRLATRFVIPAGVATIQCRLLGDGPSIVLLDDMTLTHEGDIHALRNRDLPTEVSLWNQNLRITVHTATATLEVEDLRHARRWIQQTATDSLVVLDAEADDTGIRLRLLDAATLRELAAGIRLEAERPECVLTLRGDGEMEGALSWPPPFETAAGQHLILPVNEGISYPADDASLSPMHYILYGGHGLCMPWYGVTDGEAGWMALVESPDDAAVRVPRVDGLLCLAPEWHPQRGRFGPERTLRYVFFDRGGYVAMAKRYRAYAGSTGLLKTLAAKREAIPAVDRLVGAVNVWCWDDDAPAICREMQAAGIDRILWSNGRPPDELRALNDLGVLTSRYDIYQDAMNPDEFPRLRWIHGDWTTEAWGNDDLLIGADGRWVRGWEVEAKDGGRIPCGTLCDRQALAYAERRIPPELATHPYRCRFIDTTTASPWRECHHPRHPMTRSESRQSKMDLLQYISETCGLVCGSETGHDAAVPYVHYFEGMLSLGPYRVPDAGRDMRRIWTEVPERVATFQTGHRYRLPLWELVYHDCVVAQWYWGDYNNKLPALWRRRDLWNVLYGTPPMFMFDRRLWTELREQFAASYRAIAPVARAAGYAEMQAHRWLTPDHAVQQTQFDNAVTVTVNFGDTAFTLPDGRVVAPLGFLADGVEAEAPTAR
jgi:hypothetical protein